MANEKGLAGYPSIDKPWLKYYSEEAINTPLPECTIYEYLWENNRDYQNNIALSYFNRKITYGKLFSNIDKTTKAFAAVGVKKDDIIVIVSVTTPETVYAFYALNRLGAISNMVDPRTSVDGIREYITEVQAKYIMVIDACYEKISEAVNGTKIEQIIVTSPVDSLPVVKKLLYSATSKLKSPGPLLPKGILRWKDFIQKGLQTKPKLVPYQKNTCCVIVHTGGTTGSPKGVMLSNDNVNALVLQSILTGIDMQRNHTWLDIMPPFIAYGIGMGLHLPLSIGMETILIPQFDPFKFDELLIKHKPIHMVGVPSYWGTILKSPKMQKEDLSYIIAPTVGGDSMDATLERTANEFLKQHGCSYGITKGYGMTEVCAGVSGTVDSNNEIGSVGIPFVKTIIAIINPQTGEELPYNKSGEICIHSPNTMIGYYMNEKATAEIIKVHKDGLTWVHTGDIGYMNERGSLFILDRMKRMIVRYDGFKVFPSLIERTIMHHECVGACCVVSVKDNQHSQGKLPFAYIVLKSNCTVANDDVRKDLVLLCKKELPEYAQPVDYKVISALPLTPIGKVDYLALERMAAGEESK